MTDTNDNNNTTAAQPVTPADADATDVLFGADSRPEPARPWTADANSGADQERLRPRFGTILWGVILLVFAAFMVTTAVVPVAIDPGTWIIGGLVAGGVVLVLAGIAAAVRRTG